MLQDGMVERGHMVETWTASAFFYKLPIKSLKKWFGYIDQFLIFPILVRLKLLFTAKDVLFVFADQALGPWVPLVKKRPHVIHCHDFIAQKSALGLLEENNIGKTGKLYQKFIKWGYNKGQNFISISKNTQKELHTFLEKVPEISKVVYNGLNQKFIIASNKIDLLSEISKEIGVDVTEGYLLHVGGNQFYKNRKGVLELYNEWSSTSNISLPLLMVGKPPTKDLQDRIKNIETKENIYFLENISDKLLKELYQGATVFLFPSLYEGFGWPIAEAMASGCPVITTNNEPMCEVGGNAAFYIDKMNTSDNEIFHEWKVKSAKVLNNLISLNYKQREELVVSCVNQASNFDTDKSLDQIENIYKKIKR